MSYEAEAHPAQMKILRALLLAPSANFAALQRTTGLSSDHFNFHVQKLLHSKFIEKLEDGKYSLTRAGKEYANRMDTDEAVIERQPKISVALVIENEKGEFLTQQRLKQPYFGFWGRPTGKIRWGESFVEAAARELMEETGLTADLQVKGFFHKLDVDKVTGELLEDKLFCVVYGKNPQGILIGDGEGHHNEWLSNEAFEQKEKRFASVPKITAITTGKTIDFTEQTYRYGRDEY